VTRSSPCVFFLYSVPPLLLETSLLGRRVTQSADKARPSVANMPGSLSSRSSPLGGLILALLQ